MKKRYLFLFFMKYFFDRVVSDPLCSGNDNCFIRFDPSCHQRIYFSRYDLRNNVNQLTELS